MQDSSKSISINYVFYWKWQNEWIQKYFSQTTVFMTNFCQRTNKSLGEKKNYGHLQGNKLFINNCFYMYPWYMTHDTDFKNSIYVWDSPGTWGGMSLGAHSLSSPHLWKKKSRKVNK